MSVRNPQVIEGARGPRDQRDEQYGKGAPRATGHDQVPSGKRIFQSLAAKYKLQLTAPEDLRLADGRLMRGAPPKRADFNENFLILDVTKDKDVIKFLDDSPYNKANGGLDFWDFQTVLDGIVDRRRQQAVEVLSNPADREAIIALLKAEGIDFDLPKSAKPKGTTPAPEA